MTHLAIKDLHVAVEGNEIIKGVNLEIKSGEVHAIMGPNGSGKSTLSMAVMGSPMYEITKGSITLDGQDITSLQPDQRAGLGLFLSFQYPSEVPGVKLADFLRICHNTLKQDNVAVLQFRKTLYEEMDKLKIDRAFADRYINTGFSGGEKKRSEILQLGVLKPRIAILDETDSGLDIDALKIISHGVNESAKKNTGILLITHYQRILKYIHPDHVHVMIKGRIVKSGGRELAEKLEEQGYDWVIKEAGGDLIELSN